MRSRYIIAAGIVCSFLAIVFVSAFINNPHYPARVIAGESSVGTWASGMLLVMAATISLVFAMRRGWLPWSVITLFFLVLALDERFMFHENLKTDIIFYYGLDPSRQSVVAELPVIAGALAGLLFAIVLWRQLNSRGRMLLVGAAVLGVASVAIDVFALGVLLEDSFKVFAELLVVCALLTEV
jgi:hypothetical protein